MILVLIRKGFSFTMVNYMKALVTYQFVFTHC